MLSCSGRPTLSSDRLKRVKYMCRRLNSILQLSDRANWVKMVKKLKRPAGKPLFSSNKRPATHNERSDPVASTSAGSNAPSSTTCPPMHDSLNETAAVAAADPVNCSV